MVVAILGLCNLMLLRVSLGEVALPVAWPIAPPLTHIPAMGLSVLDPSGPPPSPREGAAPLLRGLLPRVPGAPRALAASLAENPEVPALSARAQALRYAIQQDAARIAAVIGPDRLEGLIRARPELSARYGEAMVWGDLRQRLSP